MSKHKTNEALIAAAPEMLMALKAADKALTGELNALGYEGKDELPWWSPLRAIRDAIAKAEGSIEPECCEHDELYCPEGYIRNVVCAQCGAEFEPEGLDGREAS